MMNPSQFIFLYTIISGIIYVHYPSKISYAAICFENNTYSNYPNYPNLCHYMKINKINNDTFTFSYKMEKPDIESNFFKIFYYYPNQSFIDTKWTDKNLNKLNFNNNKFSVCNTSITLKQNELTNISKINTINEDCQSNIILNYIILFLNSFIILITLLILYYSYMIYS